MARVYHELARSGTFSANVKTITRVITSDSALSQRALSIGWKLIDEILPVVLRPLADLVRHPDAFHRGYRLLYCRNSRLVETLFDISTAAMGFCVCSPALWGVLLT